MKSLQSKEIIAKAKRWALPAAVLVLAIIMCLWVGATSIRTGADRGEQAPINLAGADLTEQLLQDGEITQKFSFDGKLVGVTVSAHTRQTIIHGTLTAEILSQDGKVLAIGHANLAEFLNKTPKAIFFDKALPKSAQGQRALTLRLSAVYDDPAQTVAFIKDATAKVMGASLSENGEKTDGMLTFSVVENLSGPFIYIYFAVVAGLLLLALVLAFFMVNVWKVKLPILFAVLSMVLGICVSLVLPPHISPDEEVHITSAYVHASRLLGKEATDDIGNAKMRASDLEYTETPDSFGVFTYQQVYNGLFRQVEDDTMVTAPQKRVSTMFPISYLPSIVGVFLARLLGFGYITVVMVGRLFNLAAYTALCAFGIHWMPKFGKKILFVVCLLPMSLQIAASFSYDASVLGVAVLYTAFCVKMSQETEAFSIKQWVTMLVLALLLAPGKAIYVFLCALCLLIPATRMVSKKRYLVVMGSVFLAAGLSFLMFNHASLTKLFSTLTQKTASPTVVVQAVNSPSPNGELVLMGTVLKEDSALPESESESAPESAPSITDEETEEPPVVDYVAKEFFDLQYILKHPLQTMRLLLRTVQENSVYYLRQMVGGHPGEPIMNNLPISGLFIAGLYFLLFASTLQKKKERAFLPKKQKVISGAVLMCVMAAMTVVMLSWTPLQNTAMWGMQGRYFLPVLPLFLMLAQGRRFALTKSIDKLLVFGVVFLNMCVILNIFVLVLG